MAAFWVASLACAYWVGLEWAATAPPTPAQPLVHVASGPAATIVTPDVVETPEPPLTDDEAREQRIERHMVEIYYMAPEDYPAALERYIKLENSHSEVMMLLTRWAEHDPQGAFEAVLNLEDSRWLNVGMGCVFAVWSRRDPYAAFDAYQEHLADERVPLASEQAYYGLAAVDPDRALAEMDAYGHNLNMQLHNRTRGIAKALVEHYDLPTAVEFLHRAVDTGKVSIVTGDVLTAWARYDFEGTTRFAKEYNIVHANDRFLLSARAMAEGGLDIDRDRVLAWADEEDKYPRSDFHTKTVLEAWKWRDKPAAESWVLALPESPRRAKLIEKLNISANE